MLGLNPTIILPAYYQFSLPHLPQERSHKHIRFPQLRSSQEGWTILDTMRHHIKPLVEAGACVEDAELVLRCGPITVDDKISNLTNVDHQDKRTGAETFTAVSRVQKLPIVGDRSCHSQQCLVPVHHLSKHATWSSN